MAKDESPEVPKDKLPKDKLAKDKAPKDKAAKDEVPKKKLPKKIAGVKLSKKARKAVTSLVGLVDTDAGRVALAEILTFAADALLRNRTAAAAETAEDKGADASATDPNPASPAMGSAEDGAIAGGLAAVAPMPFGLPQEGSETPDPARGPDEPETGWGALAESGQPGKRARGRAKRDAS